MHALEKIELSAIGGKTMRSSLLLEDEPDAFYLTKPKALMYGTVGHNTL